MNVNIIRIFLNQVTINYIFLHEKCLHNCAKTMNSNENLSLYTRLVHIIGALTSVRKIELKAE